MLPALASVDHEVGQPLFTFLNPFLAKGQGNCLVVGRSSVLEGNAMSMHVREVLLRFLRSAGTQTFVVFYFPRFDVGLHVLPLIELWNAVKGQLLLLVSGLDDGGDELLQEVVAQQ